MKILLLLFLHLILSVGLGILFAERSSTISAVLNNKSVEAEYIEPDSHVQKIIPIEKETITYNAPSFVWYYFIGGNLGVLLWIIRSFH